MANEKMVEVWLDLGKLGERWWLQLIKRLFHWWWEANFGLHCPTTLISTPLLPPSLYTGHAFSGIGTAHQSRGIELSKMDVISRDTGLVFVGRMILCCPTCSLLHPPSLLLFTFQHKELHKFLLLERERWFYLTQILVLKQLSSESKETLFQSKMIRCCVLNDCVISSS